jgi:hypothetical protein
MFLVERLKLLSGLGSRWLMQANLAIKARRKPPCGLCNRGAPFDGPFDPDRHCRDCWYYHNNPHIGFAGGSAEDGYVAPVPHAYNPPEPVYPSLTEQAVNVAKATTEWIAAGRPERSDEECKRIHSICEACEHFDRAQDRCRRCGCGLSKESGTSWVRLFGIPDAIKMQTHHCPIGKW